MVLFSHGMKGTDRAQAWLGAALAKRGAITEGAITEIVNHRNPYRREIQFVTSDRFFNQDISI